jgi:hypothetical protein
MTDQSYDYDKTSPIHRDARFAPCVNGHRELQVGGQMISRLADSTSPGGWTVVLRMVG